MRVIDPTRPPEPHLSSSERGAKEFAPDAAATANGGHAPPEAAVDYRRRAVAGGAALVIRQSVVKGAAIVGGVILARVLTPEVFGTYAIVTFAVAAFSLVGDMGLGAALIQQDREPSDHEFRLVFTLQLVVFGLAALAIVASGPWIVARFGLGSDALWLMRALAAGLIISALRTLPAVRLERHLEFAPLAFAEAAQALVFQGTAVAAALSGFGAVSFGVAAVASAIAATAIVNIVSPWRPGLAWDSDQIRRLLRFGLPFQGIGALTFLRDAVNPLFIGIVAGTAAVGYINWATIVVSYPLLMSAILSRLYFPAFSRLRSRLHEAADFGSAVIRWMAFIGVGLIVPFLPMATFWTDFVFGDQWVAAVPLLYLLAISIPFTAAAAVGLGILNASGRSAAALGFSALWFAGTWVATVPAVLSMGWVGFGIANALVTLCVAPFFYRAVEQSVPVKSLWSLFPSLAAGAIAVAAGVTVTGSGASNFGYAMGIATGSFAVYVSIWMLLCRQTIRHDLALLRSLANNSHSAMDSAPR